LSAKQKLFEKQIYQPAGQVLSFQVAKTSLINQPLENATIVTPVLPENVREFSLPCIYSVSGLR
jgi:hypothetical protein